MQAGQTQNAGRFIPHNSEGAMRVIRVTAPKASERAVVRASRAWRECAVHVRGELRALGVRGELRRVDDYASGARGVSTTRTLAEFVAFCRESGLSRETGAARLGDFVMTVVSEGYAESGAA